MNVIKYIIKIKNIKLYDWLLKTFIFLPLMCDVTILTIYEDYFLHELA